MTQEQIDLINKVVWFIPFKNKRNAVRNFLNSIVENINIINSITQHSVNQNQQITDLIQHSINQNQQIIDLLQHSINQNNYINKETLNYILTLKKELLELKGNKEKNNKKVIYTCITDRYDNLFVHTYINNDWDYICFTDDKYLINAQIYGNWIIKPLQFNELDNTRNNRWHKMHPHIILKEYDHSIYLDGNIDIKTSYLFECINNCINNNETISIPKHYLRDCLYDEADIVCKYNIDNPDIVKTQMEIYRNENFPEHYGFTENNCIYRKHNDQIIMKTMEEWWYWVKNYSKRDQLSLFYALWKNNIKMEKYLTDMPIRYDFNNFNWFYHKKSNETLLEESKRLGFV
ncbi:hypothetical protein BRSU_2797 [Brachyspira suanatina]|uniref:TOD1/MUCI70 glycosyltransferase-like domain-containing protein n=1 Tax=Brachyspira suanatina TaxID=381802 RepID=A0A0G4KAN2_9SPIR|nr:glycosyltransferase domain-containing protein [Brachyspira suanatina]CRF35674.1 hypothetical protein BRSU_2797 [Brachyspira suanatina]